MAGDLAHNMTVLAKHADQKNAHFSVLARVLIRQLGLLKGMLPPMAAAKIPDITYESLSQEFALFDLFAKSPNFKTKIREWFMGEDIEKLVVELASQEEGQEELTDSPLSQKEDGGAQGAEEYPEGATIFGGDYADHAQEADSQEGEGSSAVPEVQGEDSGEVGPETQEDGEDLPEVRT